MISDKIISPLQSVNPGGAEKVDWDPATKTAFVITGEYTDDKGGQVVAVDYSKGYDNGEVVAEKIGALPKSQLEQWVKENL